MRWVYPSTQGKVTWFTGPRLTIGRGDDCECHLHGAEISRNHAEIRSVHPVFVLRDLGSRNGVYVNGSRVCEVALSPGDLIRLGEWIGVVIKTEPKPPGAVSTFAVEQGLVAGPVLLPVLKVAKQGAATDLPFVIQGESGTGKELVARAVHTWSKRSDPFLPINCAALPETLAEAMLFGHRRGAFTGAVQDSRGCFRAAQGGTLFLDEIADLPLALQAKLLRAIEQGEVIPVGEDTPICVDVRIVAATQVPLFDKVRDGTFRRDLAARLDGVSVVLPPVRNRVEEIPYLFDWFLHKHGGPEPPRLEPRFVEALCLYDWPSNVREIEHLVRRLIGLAPGATLLRATQLPDHMVRAQAAVVSDEAATAFEDGLAEREAADFARLAHHLRMSGGNIARSAAVAGISRQRAYRLLDAHPEFNIDAIRRRTHGEPAADDHNGQGSE